LGLAQALINRPEILFLDEPVSALDPVGRKEILELIAQLRGQCTVFMSTHILADVERVCDSIGIIARGKLIAEAKQEELVARYAVPAFEIECNAGSEAALPAWADKLRASAWVDNVNLSGAVARVVVKDVETAKRELLNSVMKNGLVLTRYEMVRPSLEDVFLRLIGQGTGSPKRERPSRGGVAQ
jgi:ABC-2 type transport system ATP-binding protein